MSHVNVTVTDATGAKSREVELPDDAPAGRLLAVLIEKLAFPKNGPDGQLLTYRFHHRQTGRQLLDDQTLSDIGVRDGDLLRVMPEITAGRFAAPVVRSPLSVVGKIGLLRRATDNGQRTTQ